MDLSRPYSAVCPSLDGPVLNALYHTTRPMTGREISRLLPKGSEQGTRLVLDRISTHGLVVKERAGAAWLYSLNRRHLAFEAVKQLMELRSGMFDGMRELIANWSVKPVHAWVFGSAARGDGGVESDIDLFLVRSEGVSADDAAWLHQLEEFADDIKAMTGNHVATIEASLSELEEMARREAPIVKSLRREAITLAGVGFQNLGVLSMMRRRR
jgi:predicted nucleotidyltransferase